MKDNVYSRFCGCVGSDNVATEELMKNHTTFRIGGPAEYFLTPRNAKELQELQKICKEENVPYYIIGNGSNLLVSDGGLKGAVIQIYHNMNQVVVEGNIVRAQAGILLSALAKMALDRELSGLAFASGIPGTVGGAVVMNAGAYGGEMKDVISEVTVMTPAGEILHISKDQLELGYRTSVVKKKNYIVLEVVLQLQPGDRTVIQAEMEQLKEQRVSKQPLQYPSAGSTFKRPEGYFAGKLIMDAGLRGYRVGGAQVAEKHCGFVINRGAASAQDVVRLMNDVKAKVKEQFGVELEPEVQFLGEFKNEE